MNALHLAWIEIKYHWKSTSTTSGNVEIFDHSAKKVLKEANEPPLDFDTMIKFPNIEILLKIWGDKVDVVFWGTIKTKEELKIPTELQMKLIRAYPENIQVIPFPDKKVQEIVLLKNPMLIREIHCPDPIFVKQYKPLMKTKDLGII